VLEKLVSIMEIQLSLILSLKLDKTVNKTCHINLTDSGLTARTVMFSFTTE
jgi:hypothetical protein